MRALVCPLPFSGTVGAESFFSSVKKVAEPFGYACDRFPVISDSFCETYAKTNGGNTLPVQYTDANFFKKSGFYAVTEESGALSVSDLLSPEKTLIKDPLFGTSRGVGEVVKTLLVLKKKKIVLHLSDGCFFDCGLGFLSALGATFTNAEGDFCPTAATMGEILSYDLSAVQERLSGVTIEVLCDKRRTLAEAISDLRSFGGKERDIDLLDSNIENLIHQKRIFGDFSDFPGAGEGGGIAALLTALFGAKTTSLFDFFSDSIDLRPYDLIVTGECGYFFSRFDGEFASRLIERAKKEEKRVLSFADVDRYGQKNGLFSGESRREVREGFGDRMEKALFAALRR